MHFNVETTRINAPNEPRDQGIKSVLTIKDNEGNITAVFEREYWTAPSHHYAAAALIDDILAGYVEAEQEQIQARRITDQDPRDDNSRYCRLVALYAFGAHYHSGQWSRGYRISCQAQALLRRDYGDCDHLAPIERQIALEEETGPKGITKATRLYWRLADQYGNAV